MIEKRIFPEKWAAICLLNLFLASVLGVIMRYKINFPLPALNQSNVLHAHSHLVFEGWITLVLFCCFVQFILPSEKRNNPAYRAQFWLMFLSAIGMLISFLLQGYSPVSIAFSTFSQFVFYWFAIQFIIDVTRSKVAPIIRNFAIAAILSAVISSIGAYALGYFSLTGSGSPIITRGSIYFYLHFQYNGWFSFAVIALFFQWLQQKKVDFSQSSLKWIFILMAVGIIPGYFLSLMGYYNKFWVHLFSWFSILTQLAAVYLFVKELFKNKKSIISNLSTIKKWLWGIALLSFLTKTILQALSLHPDLAIVAFSLRPLVIGYLHLIFICMISFFIFGYLIHQGKLLFSSSILAKVGLVGFFLFSILNEVALFLQAFGYYFSFHFPTIPKNLFLITIGMSLFLFFFLLGQLKKSH